MNIFITFLFVLALKYYAMNILITIFVFVGNKVLWYEHLLVLKYWYYLYIYDNIAFFIVLIVVMGVMIVLFVIVLVKVGALESSLLNQVNMAREDYKLFDDKVLSLNKTLSELSPVNWGTGIIFAQSS